LRKSMKRNLITKIILILILLVLIGMFLQLFPIIEGMLYHTDENDIVNQITSIGWRGVPALISLSAFQVIIPVIPAPIIGVVSGLSFGVFGGGVIFLLGFALGNAFVMVFVRELRTAFTGKRKKKNNSTSALKERINKIKRPEIAALLITMIPFVSSLGPYLFTETNIKLRKFILAVTIGNLPSAFLYVYLGQHISDGNHTIVFIIIAVAVVAIIFALIFRKKIMEFIFKSEENF